MTYAEIEFLLAEGVLKGWIQGDVAAHYKKGIQASHDYYQVSYTPFGWQDFSDFYENSSVAYTTPMDVWEQKWLSLYFSALDPYFEVRRWYTTVGGWDGLPFLNAPIGNNFNNYELPMRFLYPGIAPNDTPIVSLFPRCPRRPRRCRRCRRQRGAHPVGTARQTQYTRTI